MDSKTDSKTNSKHHHLKQAPKRLQKQINLSILPIYVRCFRLLAAFSNLKLSNDEICRAKKALKFLESFFSSKRAYNLKSLQETFFVRRRRTSRIQRVLETLLTERATRLVESEKKSRGRLAALNYPEIVFKLTEALLQKLSDQFQ